MRKYYAFLLFLSFFFQNLCAKQITLEEAFGLANRFFASVTSDRGSNTRTTSSVLTLAYTSVIPADSKDTRAFQVWDCRLTMYSMPIITEVL